MCLKEKLSFQWKHKTTTANESETGQDNLIVTFAWQDMTQAVMTVE